MPASDPLARTPRVAWQLVCRRSARSFYSKLRLLNDFFNNRNDFVDCMQSRFKSLLSNQFSSKKLLDKILQAVCDSLSGIGMFFRFCSLFAFSQRLIQCDHLIGQ